ncbi:H-NS family nucleoid-associated regulatory protein [Bathymodiolus japonicus methanotrophic gill symbiont]|nr:H-NS family nucleoid-associated regulatory protein [Bathymodiolus japonicus methanotrophic gill symbiont]
MIADNVGKGDLCDRTLTWSGRGRKPKWIGTYLASGKLLVDIEIV